MKLLVFRLTLLTLLIKASESLDVDNNQFMIYNKKYHKARITQFGKSDVGTYEQGPYSDQLWTMETHPTQKGCYYMVNEKYPTSRIANSKHKLVIYGGNYFDDQLVRLEPSGSNDGYFYIYSCYYRNDRIAKYGSGNSNMGFYSGGLYSDQLWKFVPRFDAAKIGTYEVFHFDNRQGSAPITREVTVTRGITRSSSSTITNKTTFKASMSVSLGAGGMSGTLESEFSLELENSFSESNESSWSKTENIKFTIPAGKNYKVMQHQANFKGPFADDTCSLLSSIKIFESYTADFADKDNFIVSY